MSIEEEDVQETEEEEETLEETLDESQDDLEGAGDSVEQDEGQEAEDVDEKGVPIKNRIAEQVRKETAALKRQIDELTANSNVYKELITNLNKPKQEQQTTEQILKSLDDSEYEAVGIAPEVAKILRKSQYIEAQRAIADKLAETDQQNKQNQTVNQEFMKNRIAAIKETQAGLDGEFGNLVIDDGKGGIKYDAESPLFKRAKEIFERSPHLQEQAAGPAIAAQKAELELTKEKYGKGTDKKTSKAERLKGTSSGRGGKPSSAVKSGGKFHRELTIAEFDKLSRDDKSEYNIWHTLERTKPRGR